MRKESKHTDEYKSVFGNRAGSHSASNSTADWAEANPEKVRELILAATSRGGAVRFGYTRDGGAYALGLYYGGQAETKYCRPVEDLDAFLDEWTEVYTALPNSRGVSPEQ